VSSNCVAEVSIIHRTGALLSVVVIMDLCTKVFTCTCVKNYLALNILNSKMIMHAVYVWSLSLSVLLYSCRNSVARVPVHTAAEEGRPRFHRRQVLLTNFKSDVFVKAVGAYRRSAAYRQPQIFKAAA